MTGSRQRAAMWYVLAAIWMGLIYRASATPDLRAVPWVQWLGMLPADLSRQLSDVLELILRKGAHMVEFGVLAGFLLSGLRTGFPKMAMGKRPWVALVVATAYAVTDEWHQSFVPTRAARVTDVGIDLVGAAIGVLLVVWAAKAMAARRG